MEGFEDSLTGQYWERTQEGAEQDEREESAVAALLTGMASVLVAFSIVLGIVYWMLK